MKLVEAENLAIKNMIRHGLVDSGWMFYFDNAKRRFGYCQWKKKRISLSRELTLLNNEDQVLDTILHEIAHALAGSKAGHGKKWRNQAIAIGCSGSRVYGAEVSKPAHRWTGTCPNSHTTQRMKRMRLSCSRCCPTWNPKFMFVWSENNTSV